MDNGFELDEERVCGVGVRRCVRNDLELEVVDGRIG